MSLLATSFCSKCPISPASHLPGLCSETLSCLKWLMFEYHCTPDPPSWLQLWLVLPWWYQSEIQCWLWSCGWTLGTEVIIHIPPWGTAQTPCLSMCEIWMWWYMQWQHTTSPTVRRKRAGGSVLLLCPWAGSCPCWCLVLERDQNTAMQMHADQILEQVYWISQVRVRLDRTDPAQDCSLGQAEEWGFCGRKSWTGS